MVIVTVQQVTVFHFFFSNFPSFHLKLTLPLHSFSHKLLSLSYTHTHAYIYIQYLHAVRTYEFTS